MFDRCVSNWLLHAVTVQGYEQCTGTRHVRWYFISFNFVTALVMLNLLTGVVLDMYSLYFEDDSDSKVSRFAVNGFVGFGFVDIELHKCSHSVYWIDI